MARGPGHGYVRFLQAANRKRQRRELSTLARECGEGRRRLNRAGDERRNCFQDRGQAPGRSCQPAASRALFQHAVAGTVEDTSPCRFWDLETDGDVKFRVRCSTYHASAAGKANATGRFVRRVLCESNRELRAIATSLVTSTPPLAVR